MDIEQVQSNYNRLNKTIKRLKAYRKQDRWTYDTMVKIVQNENKDLKNIIDNGKAENKKLFERIEQLNFQVKSHTDENNQMIKEYDRMQGVIDDLETKNREAQIKLNLAQNKINHLTSVAKSLTAVL